MNAAAPGLIATEMLDTIPARVLDSLTAKIPAGGSGVPRR